MPHAFLQNLPTTAELFLRHYLPSLTELSTSFHRSLCLFQNIFFCVIIYLLSQDFLPHITEVTTNYSRTFSISLSTFFHRTSYLISQKSLPITTELSTSIFFRISKIKGLSLLLNFVKNKIICCLIN